MYSSYVFLSENRKLLPAFGHHMFVREDFDQDKDISAIKIKPGVGNETKESALFGNFTFYL